MTSILTMAFGSNGLASEEPRYCISRLRGDPMHVIVDDYGVPVLEYGYVAGVDIGPQRNPITVVHRALHNYDVFINSSTNYAYFNFLSNADWLVSHASEYGNFSVFEYKFPLHYPSTIILPVWRSAMAQGLAVEALSKAFVVTGNESYIESAKKLLNAFYVEVDDGGVTHKTNDRGWWYELLANNQVKPQILNGHLFALLGIYEYYDTTSDPSAKFLFDQGITALKNNLARFDYENGTYSYYDLSSKRLLSPSYHRLVVSQLQDLYEVTRDPTIKQYFDKWQDFELPSSVYKSEICRRTLLPPVPIFKPADYGIRIGPSDYYNSINATSTKSLYSLDFPEFGSGTNLTSQPLNYHALNVTLLPYGSKNITFTLNIEEIYQPSVQVQVIFGSNSTLSGWINESLYVINAGLKESITVHPSRIIGEDYIRVRSINVFLPEISPLGKVAFGVKIQ